MCSRDLNLTEAQQKEIQTLLHDTEVKMIKYRADIETKQLDLQAEMQKDEPGEATAIKLVREIGDIRTNMQVARVQSGLKLKKLLGPEKLKEIKQMLKERRPGPGRGQMKDKMRERFQEEPEE